MTRHFGKYVAVPDGYTPEQGATAAVLDRTTDKPVVSGLPAADAEQLASDWSRHEPPAKVER